MWRRIAQHRRHEQVRGGEAVLEIGPPDTHATLALVVIATSWVGWKTSQAKGNLQRVHGVFEWPFVVLLSDVLLVVLYYVLAHGVEKPERGGRLVASTNNETLIIMLIFVGYVVWDVLTKWVMDARRTWQGARKRIQATILCLGLAVLSWWLLWDVHRTGAVVLTDAALMLLVLALM